MSSISEELKKESKKMIRQLNKLHFASPITHVYNPLVYAWDSYAYYLDTYGASKKNALFLGMNPGPFGMAQTGIPFGEIAHVRDWMKVKAKVGKPKMEHPKRPVVGFDCEKSEVSGRRLWGYFSEIYPDPKKFFKNNFVLNYCPLVFMEESGKNRTPDKLPVSEAEPLNQICDEFLKKAIELFEPKFLIGVGAFAESNFKRVADEGSYFISKILHPSPASPAANRGWKEAAQKQLNTMGCQI